MPAIEVAGLKEFQAAVRRGTDSELPKRLGEAHRVIGAMVIAKLTPAPDPVAVGAGTGATVRPSATKREVILRAGGGHRASGPYTRMQLWGRTRVGRVGVSRPPRPYIRGTIDKYSTEIGDEYLRAISAAMAGAFAKTTP